MSAANNQPATGIVCVGDQVMPIGQLDLASGVLRVIDADGESAISLEAPDLLEILDVLDDHRARLREVAESHRMQQVWDEANGIMRHLLGRGVSVVGIERDFDESAGRYAGFVIKMFTAADVRANAMGVEVTETERNGFVTTRARVTPGVVLQDLSRVEVKAGESA